MKISTRLGGALVLCAVALVGCTPIEGLSDYCPANPMRRHCPSGDCSGEYECVGYCVEHYPDGTGVPETGMGSWCDHPELPDYAAWCPDHGGVAGCPEYCETHDCAPGETDGDGDDDGDRDDEPDAARDGDGDDDGDGDGDADEPPVFCEEDGDCTSDGASRCFEGLCVPCLEDGDCSHIPGLPACLDSACRQCSLTQRDECAAATPLCDTSAGRCVECLGSGDCPLASASACDPATGRCVPCAADGDCNHVPGLPACDGGTCQLCDADNATLCTGATPYCDAARHDCVGCLANAHCPLAAASSCETSVGECRPCAADAACSHIPGLPACAGGTCVECDAENTTLCTGGTPYCNLARYECVACLADSHCTSASASRCETLEGTCMACAADSQCGHIPGLPACDGGVCYECDVSNATLCTGSTPACNVAAHDCVACMTSGDCGSASAARCSTSTHTCVACSMDSDCTHLSGLRACDRGVCYECDDTDQELCRGSTPYCDTVGHDCDACLADSHCPSASASRCSGGSCAGCVSDANCSHIAGRPACDRSVCYECDLGNATECSGATPVCSVARHECVRCISNAQCLSATASRCNVATNTCVSCIGDADCAQVSYRPHCLGGTCGCTAHSECPSGLYCLDHVCSRL